MALTRVACDAELARRAERRDVAVPARLTWKDASGAVRFTSVMTRNVSDAGLFVEADTATAIPLYRIVHVQLERSARDAEGIPVRLREGRVMSAVWRVAPCHPSRGTPAGYALRFLVEPRDNARPHRAEQRMAVAS